jgi:hypothetical protein
MKALYVCLLNNGEAFCCTYVHILWYNVNHALKGVVVNL